MNDLAVIEQAATLPAMVRRAASFLANAETAAEILEAREFARMARTYGDSAVRLAKLKGAHDEVISAIYHAQADALEIEFMAKRRLADAYDEAKAAGNVRAQGGDQTNITAENVAPTAAELGLSAKDIHEGRLVSQAEAMKPGLTRDEIAVQMMTAGRPSAAVTRRAFRETVHGVGQRPTERTVTTTDSALIDILDRCRKLDGQIEKVGIEKLADAVPDADPRLAAVPVIQALRNRLTEWLEAL